ncbi:MAG: SBBP repeat-containing protein, partial [Bacteroidetes bacterium]|nr:SBBP repeat-containing protein [Bacteroidota bacterium]
GGCPLKFGGCPLKFGGCPLKFGGQPLKFGGNPLKFGGTTTEFYRNPLKFGGNPLNISGNKTHYYNLNENNNVLLSNLTRGLAPVIDAARNNKDAARNNIDVARNNIDVARNNIDVARNNIDVARNNNKNNHPVSAIALPPLHRGELFPSCGGVGVVNNPRHTELASASPIISFDIAEYDKSNTLIIDPLIYSAVIGGREEERSYAVTTDSAGNVYWTGFTHSIDYPTRAGSYKISKIDANSTNTDVIITKLDNTGRQVFFSTYLGGWREDVGRFIKVDKDNNIYVMGHTNSADSIRFPVVVPNDANTGLTQHRGVDVFLTKFNPAGNDIAFSVLIGANNNDYPAGFGLILDTNDNISAIATAIQISNIPNAISPFISTGAVQTTHSGGTNDCYIAVISSDAKDINYATFLGGNGIDTPKDLVIDNENNILITGNTESTNYPVSDSAYRNTNSGGGDVFITKLSKSLDTILYSTYIGGSKYDNTEGIDVDNENNIYITGHTLSNNFPMTSANRTLKNDTANIFVLKMNPISGSIIYSSTITSNNENYATGIVVDGNHYAHISGYTTSTDYPITWDAFFDSYSAHGDALYSVINATGDSLVFSSYIGGDQYEYAYGLALDNLDAAYICGATTSNERFPHNILIADSIYIGYDTATNSNIFEKTLGSYDCFIFKAIYKPYPGELITNIDLIGSMFCPGSYLDIVIATPFGFYYDDNEFRVQLSDANGNFSANYTTNIIGTLQASQGGSVRITFPSNLTNSKHYRIRVISTHPRSVGYPNDIDLDISHPYIELDTNNFPAKICSGGVLESDIGSNICFNDNNVYSVQLSDANGSFSNPTILATYTGSGAFSITTAISDTLPVSNKYKIRVISSSPQITSNEINFEITKSEIILDIAQIELLQGLCAGDSLDFGFLSTECFNSDNIFYLLLSDTLGSFNTNDTIGAYVGNGSNDMLIMKVTIPQNLPFSEKYKIKLISTSPQLEEVFSLNFLLGGPYIYTDNLLDLEICRDINFSLTLETNNCFEDNNVFEIYIQSNIGLIKIGETDPNSKTITLFVSNNNIPQNTTIIVRSTHPVVETAEIPITINSPEITITGHSPAELCEGNTFNLHYITNGCLVDTINAIVEMSINDTTFTTAIVIGEGKAFNNNGTISCTLPDSIDYNNRYYVRIVATEHTPFFASELFLLSINPVSVSIASDISDLAILCSGVSFYINFTAKGCFDIDNVFSIILSDVGGEFNDNSIIIGEITSDSSGRIFVSIPFDIDTSGIYRIKITSSHPQTESILDLNITIKRPYIIILSSDNLTQCAPLTTNKETSQATDIPYISFIASDCFGDENIFILQFAKNGDFSNSENIINVDTCLWNEREFYFNLPEEMGTDTFRFRIISTNPQVASNENGFDVIYNQPYITLLDSNNVSVCKNEPFVFSYQSSICFDDDNMFYLEMSDETGSFNSPIILDFNTEIGSGVFNVIIPDYLPDNIVYKLRIRSTSPEKYFVQDQIVFFVVGASIVTGNLNKLITARNDTLYVPFNTNCMDPDGKVFIVQLSDPYGNFDKASILQIGNRIGWEPNCQIYTRIPLNASDGKSYRVRVICNNPEIIGTDNGQDIVIFGFIGVQEEEKGINIIITPIPFSNELIINSNGEQIKSLSIVDILGRQRIELDLKNTNTTNSIHISTKDLETGTYIITLNTHTRTIKKVILNIK